MFYTVENYGHDILQLVSLFFRFEVAQKFLEAVDLDRIAAFLQVAEPERAERRLDTDVRSRFHVRPVVAHHPVMRGEAMSTHPGGARSERQAGRLHLRAISSRDDGVTEVAQQAEMFQDAARGEIGLVGIDTHEPAPVGQLGQRPADAWIEHRLVEHVRAVVLEILRPQLVEAARDLRDCVLQQMPRAAAHVANHLLLGKRREAQGLARIVHGARQIRARIDERSVHVEKYRIHVLSPVNWV